MARVKKEKEIIDNLKFEKEEFEKGNTVIAGVDEVGRGPLAGPVCVCAIIMPLDNIIEGVDDSKKISEKKREELSKVIRETSLSCSVAVIDEKVIDEINILEATKLCMKNAIEGLEITPNIVLVDAISKLDVEVPVRGIIKGDMLSYSIACASIVAKVERDEYMKNLAEKYPEYGFEKHKGYGTKAHIEKIKEIGYCKHHRMSFLKFLNDVEE